MCGVPLSPGEGKGLLHSVSLSRRFFPLHLVSHCPPAQEAFPPMSSPYLAGDKLCWQMLLSPLNSVFSTKYHYTFIMPCLIDNYLLYPLTSFKKSEVMFNLFHDLPIAQH